MVKRGSIKRPVTTPLPRRPRRRTIKEGAAAAPAAPHRRRLLPALRPPPHLPLLLQRRPSLLLPPPRCPLRPSPRPPPPSSSVAAAAPAAAPATPTPPSASGTHPGGPAQTGTRGSPCGDARREAPRQPGVRGGEGSGGMVGPGCPWGSGGVRGGAQDGEPEEARPHGGQGLPHRLRTRARTAAASRHLSPPPQFAERQAAEAVAEPARASSFSSETAAIAPLSSSPRAGSNRRENFAQSTCIAIAVVGRGAGFHTGRRGRGRRRAGSIVVYVGAGGWVHPAPPGAPRT